MAGSAENPMATVDPWELVADTYAVEADWMIGPVEERAIELADLGNHYQVLDLAAGPGSLVSRIARRVERVCAVDFSEAMLTCLRKRIPVELRTKVDVVCADGSDLPLYDGQFHVGFSLFGLMFFDNRDAGFQELFRVLRPGGLAIVTSWAPSRRSTLMTVVYDALEAADPEFTRPTDNPNSLENPERFKQEMTAAGFEQVKVEPYTVLIPDMPAAELWPRLVGNSASLALRKRAAGDAWPALSSRVIAELEQRLTAVKKPLNTTAFIAQGGKPY